MSFYCSSVIKCVHIHLHEIAIASFTDHHQNFHCSQQATSLLSQLKMQVALMPPGLVSAQQTPLISHCTHSAKLLAVLPEVTTAVMIIDLKCNITRYLTMGAYAQDKFRQLVLNANLACLCCTNLISSFGFII